MTDQAAFLSKCLARAQQYRLQRRIRSTESVSKVLLETAMKLAANRDLLGNDRPAIEERRAELAHAIRDLIGRTDKIGSKAAQRLEELIG